MSDLRSVEVRRAATDPGYIRYVVSFKGKSAAVVETADYDVELCAEVVEAAVRGLLIDGRPWMIR